MRCLGKLLRDGEWLELKDQVGWGVKGMWEEIWGKAAKIKGYLMGSMEI